MTRLDEINAQIAILQAEREVAMTADRANVHAKLAVEKEHDIRSNPTAVDSAQMSTKNESLGEIYVNRLKKSLSGDVSELTALHSSIFKGAIEGFKEIYKAKEAAARAKEDATIAQVALRASFPAQEPFKQDVQVSVESENTPLNAAAKIIKSGVAGYKLGKWL